MTTTKSLLIAAALTAAASLGFAKAPAAPQADASTVASAAKPSADVAAKPTHAKKHHRTDSKHSAKASKAATPATSTTSATIK